MSDDVLELEIVRALLLEINSEITDEEVSKIYGMCCGNPWNADKLYCMFRGEL